MAKNHLNHIKTSQDLYLALRETPPSATLKIEEQYGDEYVGLYYDPQEHTVTIIHSSGKEHEGGGERNGGGRDRIAGGE